jgi:glycosyltransferase involved in cell wall biosynthesis
VTADLVATTPSTPARETGGQAELGANLVGFFHAEFGQGEVARRLATAFRHAGLPFAAIPLRKIPHRYIPHRQDHPFPIEQSDPVYDVNVVCLNAEHFPSYAETIGREVLAGRYTVGIWFWETDRFPEELLPALDYVDEIWVASGFVADAVSAETSKPVVTFPLPVLVPEISPISPETFGMGEEEFFLFAFDFLSTVERKNPAGVIEAFRGAVGPDDRAQLLIKTINGDKRPEELRELQALADSHDAIVIHDGYLPPDEVAGLTAAARGYISLHRSEGFGLTIAEAMALGKPAIATAYSGNLQFMDEENSWLVPYRLTTVPEGVGPYPAGASWADPDAYAAGRMIRALLDAPEETRRKAELGRSTVLTRQGLERTESFLRERLPLIARRQRERRRSSPASRATAFLQAGPTTGWEAPSRFGSVGRIYRYLLQRLLRPYLVRQREFDRAVAAGLEEAEAVARHHRDEIARLQQLVNELFRRHERPTDDRDPSGGAG